MSKFGVYGVPRPGVTLPELEAEDRRGDRGRGRQGRHAAELERAKNKLIADAVYAQDNQASLARWYGVALMTGSTVEDVRRWPDRIRKVTAERGE